MPGEHVRVEPDAEADDAEEVRDRLEQRHERDHRLGHAGRDEALDVLRPVPAEALDVREDDAHDREDERHRELRRDGVDPPDRNAVPFVA